MIEAVVLATGLLLILAGLGSARIPGGASFARPGISRSPLQAFLLSPIHPQTWYAVGAIVLGPFVATLAFGIVLALISTGLTTLLAGIGILFIAAAIEGSRLVAWVERWRVFVGEHERPRPHPYRPFRGGILDIVRAEFADEARWRDVLYVAVDFPLTIIEFVVVGVAWAVALVALTLPLWFEPRATLPPLWLASVAGLLLLFVAASLSQIVIATAPPGRGRSPVHVRESRAAARGRDAPPEPIRRHRCRGDRAEPYRARSARRRAAATGDAVDRPRACQ